ncbi:MAG: hypothetical protein ACK5PP_04945 [Acidimicrobiales bacterium]
MAIIFQLVVNFPVSEAAAAERARAIVSTSTVEAFGRDLQLHHRTTGVKSPADIDEGYIEFAVHPVGLSYGATINDPDIAMSEVTSDDLSAVGTQLYDLLRNLDSFQAAFVGWDSEWLVDLHDLGSDGSIHDVQGLVVSDAVARRYQLGPRFVRFEPGYRWLPYQGSSVW